jgi:hypothetical protein
MIRSAQDSLRPYFCLIGHSSRRALSRLALSGQPILRSGHHGVQVTDHRIEVYAIEFLGVIETRPHRIGERGVLVENLEVQLVRPPVAVRVPAGRPARDWAFAVAGHDASDRNVSV